jgi:hypothetical protein
MDRHFHPYGINVCSNEKTADFEFIFTSLLESLQKVGEEINIDTLISDASEAIRNAFKNIFGEDLLIIMCSPQCGKAFRFS